MVTVFHGYGYDDARVFCARARSITQFIPAGFTCQRIYFYPIGLYDRENLSLWVSIVPAGFGVLLGCDKVTEKRVTDSGILDFLCCFKKSLFLRFARRHFVTLNPENPAGTVFL